MSNKKKEIYDWLDFAQSYLCMSALGCEEMMKHAYKEDGYEDIDKYKKEYIFIPAIYNIKHGIEVFTKFLRITFSEKLEKKHKHHNIRDLFDALNEDLLKNREKIQKIITSKLAQNPDDINLQIAARDFKNFPVYMEDLKGLVLKYYNCQVIKDQIGDRFIIEDISNTFFRYPENDVKIKIDYDNLFSNIKEEKLKEIYEDINKLMDKFNGLGFILDIYKQNEK